MTSRGQDHYGAGVRFERVVRRYLEDNGYVCTRAASSKGKLDLIALKPNELLFIQAKRDGACGPAEWDRVVELAGWVNATALLAVAGTERVTDVVLWQLLDRKRRGQPMALQPAQLWTPDHGFEPGLESAQLSERRSWAGRRSGLGFRHGTDVARAAGCDCPVCAAA